MNKIQSTLEIQRTERGFLHENRETVNKEMVHEMGLK